jgi:protein required for attachment to host cells
MGRVKIEQGDWVVVCDGRKALILENAGDQMFPNLRTKEVHEREDSKTSEIGTDAPGRSFNSADQTRSSVEQTDWHEQEEERFLQALAGRLDAALGAGETKALIIVAPPRALGIIRGNYSPVLQKAVRQEVDKDYVRMPVYEIEKLLVGKVSA